MRRKPLHIEVLDVMIGLGIVLCLLSIAFAGFAVGLEIFERAQLVR